MGSSMLTVHRHEQWRLLHQNCELDPMLSIVMPLLLLVIIILILCHHHNHDICGPGINSNCQGLHNVHTVDHHHSYHPHLPDHDNHCDHCQGLLGTEVHGTEDHVQETSKTCIIVTNTILYIQKLIYHIVSKIFIFSREPSQIKKIQYYKKYVTVRSHHSRILILG